MIVKLTDLFNDDHFFPHNYLNACICGTGRRRVREGTEGI